MISKHIEHFKNQAYTNNGINIFFLFVHIKQTVPGIISIIRIYQPDLYLYDDILSFVDTKRMYPTFIVTDLDKYNSLITNKTY